VLAGREDTAVVGSASLKDMFVVDVTIPFFRQRMRLGGPVGVDFLAKGSSRFSSYS
jgi:hypothetical protein